MIIIVYILTYFIACILSIHIFRASIKTTRIVEQTIGRAL